MYYIEAPQEGYIQGWSIFLAGGISGTADWQKGVARALCGTNADLPRDRQERTEYLPGWSLFNPRRPGGLGKTGGEAADQIRWEHERLWQKDTRVIAFWFPPETLCPIALLELGSALARAKAARRPLMLGSPEQTHLQIFPMRAPKIVIGCHRDYARAFDVEQQSALADPTLQVSREMDDFIDGIRRAVEVVDREGRQPWHDARSL